MQKEYMQMISTSRNETFAREIDWYQLVLEAGARMPLWGKRGYFEVVKADAVHIQLIGNMESVYLTISDENNTFSVYFFKVEPIIGTTNATVGCRFIPVLTRSEFNTWRDTVGGLFERATQTLHNSRSK
jgi:hypothetical protein